MKLVTNGLGDFFEFISEDQYRATLAPVYSWHDEDQYTINIFWYMYSFRESSEEEMLERMSLDLYDYVMIDTK